MAGKGGANPGPRRESLLRIEVAMMDVGRSEHLDPGASRGLSEATLGCARVALV